MALKITQEYMNEYVINPLHDRLDEMYVMLVTLERKLDILLKCEPKYTVSKPEEPKIEIKPKTMKRR